MGDKPYPFNEAQEAWLRDLETTEEPQTKGFLHVYRDNHPDHNKGYCCLGRACAVLGVKGTKGTSFVSYGGMSAVLLPEIYQRLRLRDDCGRFRSKVEEKYVDLTELNDAGWTFKQIASYIRANPHNVFLPPDESDSA